MDEHEHLRLVVTHAVNIVRRRAGAADLDDLLPGLQNEPSSCPIARSLCIDDRTYVVIGEGSYDEAHVIEHDRDPLVARAMPVGFGAKMLSIEPPEQDVDGSMTGWYHMMRLPEWAAAFAEAFDAGAYPDLIAPVIDS
jgi:hypothetical protein